jgi:phosphoglycolate phosphatase
MRSITTLLVDLDGTLTDNFEGITRSIRHALAALDTAAPSDAALRCCVGPPLRQSFARLLATDDAATIERALAHYRKRYATTGWRENVVYAGIAQIIAQLAAAGATLVLCTSKPQPYAERIVADFGLAPHFSAIYGADLGGTLDDKAKLVAHLLERERQDAGACAMIGDREHDVRAAHANGVRAVGALWGYGSRDELTRAGADAIVSEPGELPAALAALARG